MGVDPTDWHEFVVGQRVMTSQGIPGVVTAVEDGFAPGHEQYVVQLEAGLGGGAYGSSELAASGAVVSAAEHVSGDARVATEDYPELGTILSDRPRLELDYSRFSSSVVARKTATKIQLTESLKCDLCGQHRPVNQTTPVPIHVASVGFATVCHGCMDSGRFVDAETAKEAGFFTDLWNAGLPEEFKHRPENNASYDWCRFRKRQRCYYPKEVDWDASRERHLIVYKPEERGYCQRHDWDAQRECPLSFPGPNSGEADFMPDEELNWEGIPEFVVEAGIQTEAGWLLGPCGDCKGLGSDLSGSPCSTCQGSGRTLVDYTNGDGPTTYAAPSLVRELVPDDIAPYGGNEFGPGGNIDPYDWAETRNDSFSMAAAKNLGFHFHARWSDIQAKAKEIRDEGRVNIVSIASPYVTGYVEGDSAIYETRIMITPGKQSVAQWECGCAWAKYSWGRSGRWKQYEGRMCSHALALYNESRLSGAKEDPSYVPQTKPKEPSANAGTPPEWRIGATFEGAAEMSKAASLSVDDLVPGESYDVDVWKHNEWDDPEEGPTEMQTSRGIKFVGTDFDGLMFESEYGEQWMATDVVKEIRSVAHVVESTEDTRHRFALRGNLRPANLDQSPHPVSFNGTLQSFAILEVLDGLAVQIGGVIDRVIGLLPGGKLKTEQSGEVPASQAWFWGYHPTLGLTASKEAAEKVAEIMAKTSAKVFSSDEQMDLIMEGELEGVEASNLDRLDIVGTHYDSGDWLI